jgi:glycosyltransferase involved in cell wall biosynthesis
MVAFEFPPMATVGVHRPVRLAQHLPQHGITPVVITTDRESVPQWSGRRPDDSLVASLPPGLAIHRVPSPRPPGPRSLWRRRLHHLLSNGDEAGRCWAPQLEVAWDRVVGETRPDAVYVTAPPFSVLPVVLRLARRTGLPLIADFRDAWSQWCHNANPSWWHYRAKLNQERKVVEGAAAIVGVTRQLVDDLHGVHPHADAAKFHALPSGYDTPLATPQRRDRTGSAGAFVIGYAGSFYYSPEMRASVMEPWWRKKPLHWPQYSPRHEDWLYRSPYFFFRALARLFERRPELRQRIRVRFAGDHQAWLDQQAAEFGVQDVVEKIGRLSHSECLEFEASADALLMTSMKVVGGRDYCIAGKTFEYLATGRPIIGIVTAGEQRDFLLSSGAARVADADDADASATAIEEVVSGKFTPVLERAFLDRFQSAETSRQLANVVRHVMRSSE